MKSLTHNTLALICRVLSLILPLVAALAQVSCINDNSQCIEDRPGYVEGRDVWFSFDISATGTAAEPQEVLRSRADDKDSHPSEAATVPENAVNPSDVILMLLDNNRNVTRVFDSSDYVVLPTGEANGSVYRLKIKVNIAYFDYAPGEDIPASLLIVANHNGTKSGETDMPVSGLLYRSATEISQQYYSFGFELKNNPSGWIPAPDKDMYIPMAGLKHFTLSRSALEASTADKPYDLGDGANAMFVQRAMAKVRIFDNIVAEATTEVTGLRLNGINSRGALMPDFVATRQTIGNRLIDWAEGTEQVEIASVLPAWYDSGSTATGIYTESEKSFDGTLSGGWVAYIPEYAASASTSGASLTVITRDTLTGEIREWTYSFADRLGIRHITRNHIYEFIVERNPSVSPVLNYTVCPWVDNEIKIPDFN